MAHIDQIIAHMVQGKMDRAVLCSDEPMHFYSGAQEVAGPMLSAVQMRNIAQDCTPPVLKPQLSQNGSFHFPYQSASGKFDITILRRDDKFKVVVTAANEITPNAITASGSSANSPAAIPDEVPLSVPVSSRPAQGETTATEAKKGIGHMDEMFHLMAQRDASDLHLSSSETPMVRIQGTMLKLNEYSICEADTLQRLLFQITPLRNREEWEDLHDSDFSYELAGVGRFRCNLFADRHGIGGVFRLIPSRLRTVADLNLPRAMVDFCFLSKGLIVVTGPTGSGKSTTLAALIDHINKHRADHIVTVEDPVEFVHENIKCLVNQREVHVNTESFAAALRASLREDPDIIMVGEMRDLETTRRAIEAAETGHLVFGTLHTSSAASTVDRIIDQFPAEEQSQIRVMLSETLKGVVAQSLLRTKDGQRVAAFEMLLVPTSVSNLIREGKTFQLPSQIQIGKSLGMMTMNESILNYVKSGRVDPAEGYLKASDKNGLLSAYESNGIALPTSAA